MQNVENDKVKELIISSRKAASAEMDAIKNTVPLTKEIFTGHLRAFVLHKFLLKEEDLTTDDFNEITNISLGNSMKISKDLVKEFDLAKSCDGGSSAMAKKVLLFMAIQRELNILLPATASARLKSLNELAAISWEEMTKSPDWEGKLVI